MHKQTVQSLQHYDTEKGCSSLPGSVVVIQARNPVHSALTATTEAETATIAVQHVLHLMAQICLAPQ